MELSRTFGITESNLAARREFIRLGPPEQRLLRPLIPWARRHAAPIAREFYDWQFTFGPTVAFFEQMARKQGITLELLRTRLETAQRDYLIEVFEGADEGWGLDYFERRLQVGHVHDRIDLPMKWYLGSYAEYERLIARHLPRRLRLVPGRRERVLRAINQVFSLDQQAVCDAYMLSVLRSMGLKLELLGKGRGEDRSEQVGEAKHRIRTTVSELLSATRRISRSSGDLTQATRAVNAGASEVASAMEQMTASIENIAAQSARAADEADGGVRIGEQVKAQMAELEATAENIDDIVRLIAKVAQQTNLLALNASVEAARAGAAGRGFAVVAEQVKKLAEEAARATVRIRESIDSLRERVGDSLKLTGEMADAVVSIHEGEQIVATAVQQQTEAVRHVANSALDSSNSAHRITQTVGSLAEIIATLDRAVSSFERRDDA